MSAVSCYVFVVQYLIVSGSFAQVVSGLRSVVVDFDFLAEVLLQIVVRDKLNGR